MNTRHRYNSTSGPSQTGQKAQLVSAYQELGKELNSTQLKVVGNYTLGRVIGEGSFGTVRIGIHRLTGTRVAIKHIPKSASPPLLTREIHHHRRLHHPNVVQLYEVIATEHSIWLITELCPGGELFDYLVEKTKFTEFETRRILGQICLGLGYVHREGVVHRDLKLENVLLDERCNPKLADFGFGREFEPRKLLDTFCGTTGYAAPEMLAGRKYLGEEVDIWSLGIIFYTLLTGSLPFDDDDEEVMKSMIMAGQYDLPTFLSNEARDLISKILQQDPKARPTIENILSHPWFTTPPSQHTFMESEQSSRPSTIAEEEQPLTSSPKSVQSFSVTDRQLDHTISQSPSIGHSLKHKSDVIAESDTSESSSKESDLGISSSRSNTSSPVTSEDTPCMRGVPDLKLSSDLPSDQTTPVKPRSNTSAQVKPATFVLQHRNNSNSTIKKWHDPNSTPCPTSRQMSATSLQRANLNSGPMHDELEDTTLNEVNGSNEARSVQSHERSKSIKVDKQDKRSSSSSSSTTVPSEVNSGKKRRPPSIVPCFPSSIIHHPQIRTPSRTKRRSVGSTISERIAPIDDLDQAGLAMSLSAVPSASTDTTSTNNALLASTSLAFVIDYLGALKITKRIPLMSEEDLDLVKSLSAIGFDTGQMMHSVQSNACDASGAFWWLLKRKLEKQAADREYAERSSARLSAASTVSKLVPVHQSTSDIARQSPSNEAQMLTTGSSTVPSDSLRPSADRPLPASFPGKLRQPSSHDELRLSPSNPRKLKAILTSSQTIEPLLNPIKIAGKVADATVINFVPSFSNSDLSPPKQPPLLNLVSDDGMSSCSSVGFETLSVTEKDPQSSSDSSRLKLPPDNRKRSQSVSMLQRATHALASKKLPDESFTKAAKAKIKDSLFMDGHERSLSEKLSRKDMKAKEKEAKTFDENIKPGSNSSRSGLFSRKPTLQSVMSPPQLPPQIPVLLTPEFSTGGTFLSPPERAPSNVGQLDSPGINRSSVSMPSSPRKTEDAETSSRRGSDPARTGQRGQTSPHSQTTLSTSTSASTVQPGSLLTHSGSEKKTISSTDTADTFSTVAADDSSPISTSDAVNSLIKAKFKDAAQNDENASPTMKGGRKGSNLFSSFRFWFNEDRRKRKRKTVGLLNYSGNTHQSFSGGNDYSTHHGGISSSSASPVSAGARPTHTESNPLAIRTTGLSSVPIHRQPSASSHRSSLKSNRRASLDLSHTRRGHNRRSDSSRASVTSLPGSRSPASEIESAYHSPSHPHQQLSLDGSRTKRHGHHRQSSNGSAGSRLSSVVVQHLGPGSAVAPHHPGSYLRRTPSAGTTVRRITTTTPSTPGGNRHRQSRNQSGASSVRTSMSSDDSRQIPEELRLHSPINPYDVEETIEEEDDGEEVEDTDGGDQKDARERALQKLSGDGGGEKSNRIKKSSGVDEESFSSNSRTTTTIFLAHKPHSVFGTPTQAFFARGNPGSPVANKFGHHSSPLVGSGGMYMNTFGPGGGGGGGGGSGSGSGRQKIRDVFASKQQQSEDGEWVDVEEDDDVCARYGGGLGQSVHRRSSTTEPVSPNQPIMKPNNLGEPPQPSTPTVFEKMSKVNAFSVKNRPGSSVLGEGRYAGVGSAMMGIGVSSSSNGISTAFKSVAIVEEEEEEEED